MTATLPLPLWQLTNGIPNWPLQPSQTAVSISVPDEFPVVWDQGPTEDSPLEIHRCMTIIGRQLSRLVVAGRGKTVVDTKTSPLDLVTEVDRGIEMLLRTWIYRFFPHHVIIGEEGGQPAVTPDDWVWVIDPIDGTNNYVAQKDDISIHICCLQKGKIVTSVVALPFYDLLFFGSDWTGSVEVEQNGIHQPVAAPKLATDWIISTEYITSHATDGPQFHQLVETLGVGSYQIKSIGVNLIRMLQGHHHLFYRNRTKLWDVLAPLCLIRIAAGDVFEYGFFIMDSRETGGVNFTVTQNINSLRSDNVLDQIKIHTPLRVDRDMSDLSYHDSQKTSFIIPQPSDVIPAQAGIQASDNIHTPIETLNYHILSPFSTDPEYLNLMNTAHRDHSGRMGIFMVYPKSDTTIHRLILEAITA